MPAVPDPRARRALLIGIDKYPRLTQLDGCVNDVHLMRSVLQENFGFPPMRSSSSGEATGWRTPPSSGTGERGRRSWSG